MPHRPPSLQPHFVIYSLGKMAKFVAVTGEVFLLLKSYALFDFDDTLIHGDSIVKMCLYACKKRLMNPLSLLPIGLMAGLYLCGLTTAEKSKQRSMRFLKGMSEEQANALAEDFCREVLVPKLYAQGVSEMKARAKEGCEVWLVSASPSFYLEPLIKVLPLSGVIATRMYVEGGVHTGLLAGENCRNVQKPLRLAEVLAARGDMLDYASSYAYGDSAGDAPMLALCGRKVAVNPKKKLLQKLEGTDGVTVVRWK